MFPPMKQQNGRLVYFQLHMTPGFLATDRPSCYVILFNYVVYTGLKSGDVARLVWLASTQR